MNFLCYCSLYLSATECGLLPLGPHCSGGHTRSSVLIGVLVCSSQSSKCEASFFSVDPHQANLQPNLLLGSCLRFNPTPTFLGVSYDCTFSFSKLFRFNPTFLGVTFDCTFSFSKHVSSLKAKFFPRLKALCCISAFSWGSSKESLSPCQQVCHFSSPPI